MSVLRSEYRRSSDLKGQQRILYVFFGFGLGLVGALFACVAVMIKPDLSYLTYYTFEVLYSTVVSYAITKHELMNIKVVINKAGAYIVTVVLFLLGYGAIVLSYRWWVSTTIDGWFVALTSGYCVVGVWWLYFQRFQRFLQSSAYKKFLARLEIAPDVAPK